MIQTELGAQSATTNERCFLLSDPALRRFFSACRGVGSVVGLQLRVRFVPAALLAMLRTALALQCVSKARDWTGHVDR